MSDIRYTEDHEYVRVEGEIGALSIEQTISRFQKEVDEKIVKQHK